MLFCFVLFLSCLFLRQGLILLPGLECSGMMITHCNLKLLGSSVPPALASHVAGNNRHVSLCLANFLFFVEAEFCCVAQAGLKLLTSGDTPVLTSQSAGITGVSHRVWPLWPS